MWREGRHRENRQVVENCHWPNVNNSLINGSVVRFISRCCFFSPLFIVLSILSILENLFAFNRYCTTFECAYLSIFFDCLNIFITLDEEKWQKHIKNINGFDFFSRLSIIYDVCEIFGHFG